MAVEREENELSEAVRGLFATVRGELAAVKGELAATKGEVAAMKGEVAAVVADKAAQQSARGLVLESSTEPVFPATTPLPPLFLLPEFILSSCRTSLCSRTPCIGLAPSAMARMTAVAMLLLGLLLALLLAAAISITPTSRQGRFMRMPAKHANFQVERVNGAVGSAMASMAGTNELKEAMEMRMRALGVQLEEKRKELEEAERKRVPEMGEVRGQMEERGKDLAAVKGELGAVQGELAAMKRELAEHKDAMAEQVEARKELSEIREELAALRRDLRGQKDFVKSQLDEAEKRHTENLIELRGQVEERKRELEKVERRRVAEMAAELAAVKGALAGHKDSMIEQLRMAERRRESGLKGLIEEVRKKEDDMRAELAREREERRREVRELNWPRAMEELAACRSWVNVEMGIIRNEVDRKTAWEVSAE
ncbi:unnamed protein product [Closterium sp. Naga37s-1]|nr:unnamed protein product [Closterium sp. Naga37s-1]